MAIRPANADPLAGRNGRPDGPSSRSAAQTRAVHREPRAQGFDFAAHLGERGIDIAAAAPGFDNVGTPAGILLHPGSLEAACVAGRCAAQPARGDERRIRTVWPREIARTSWRDRAWECVG